MQGSEETRAAAPFTCGSSSRPLFRIERVGRPRCSTPGRTEIGKLTFETFHVDPQCAAAGERQRHDTARRVDLRELDRQQIEHSVPFLRIEVTALAGKDALETQRRAAAAKFRPACMLPVEPVETDHQTLLL